MECVEGCNVVSLLLSDVVRCAVHQQTLPDALYTCVDGVMQTSGAICWREEKNGVNSEIK